MNRASALVAAAAAAGGTAFFFLTSQETRVVLKALVFGNPPAEEDNVNHVELWFCTKDGEMYAVDDATEELRNVLAPRPLMDEKEIIHLEKIVGSGVEVAYGVLTVCYVQSGKRYKACYPLGRTPRCIAFPPYTAAELKKEADAKKGFSFKRFIIQATVRGPSLSDIDVTEELLERAGPKGNFYSDHEQLKHTTRLSELLLSCGIPLDECDRLEVVDSHGLVTRYHLSEDVLVFPKGH